MVPRKVLSARLALVVVVVVASTGLIAAHSITTAITNNSWVKWKSATRAIYQGVVEVAESTAGPAALQRDMPSVTTASLYTSAFALAELGQDAKSLMSETDWSTVSSRLLRASADPQLITNLDPIAPMAYVLWEVTWADRMNRVYTTSQQTSLATIATDAGLISSLNDSTPDMADVYAALDSLRALGGLNANVMSKASTILQQRADLCTGGASADNLYPALALGALRDVASPCTVDQFSAIWDTAMKKVLDASTDITSWQATGVTSDLLLLAQSRSLWWPDDTIKESEVSRAYSNFTAAVENVDAAFDPDLSALQKTAALIGQRMTFGHVLTQRLVEQALRGTTWQTQRITGVHVTKVLAAARAVGVPLSLSASFIDSLTPLEHIAVIYGQGQVLDPALDVLLAAVTGGDYGSFSGRSAVLDTVASLLLSMPRDKSCAPPGIQILQDSLADVDSQGLDPGAVALGVRALDNCSLPSSPATRQATLGVAQAIINSLTGPPDLDNQWQAQRILCALDPAKADVGFGEWRKLKSAANPMGGAVSSDGYASLTSTYELLSIVSTTSADCRTTGLLEARP